MSRVLAAALAACCIVGAAGRAGAQAAVPAWNDARTASLVDSAIARRARQLADTGLRDWRATAHGYLTFLGQVGEGFTEPPKIVKADELALEVYWMAPDLSKQRIIGQRDTLLLPTDISYHRDHLGIIQNNFPGIIRLGDGDEVRDVPHPLSAAGRAAYDFAIADSLRIRLLDRTIDVYEVRVRPKDDAQPRAVGAVYIDRETAQVVRMAFSFTRVSYRDANLEDVSVVLENGLFEQRFWLPKRQEIEIRRTGRWLDYPARGIIRGRWEICCHAVNTGLPRSFFGGAEIVQAPTQQQRRYPWRGAVLDSLPPDVRAVTDEDVREVQEEARALVRAEALARARRTSVTARGASDFVRANRVEGLALGLAVTRRLGRGVSAEAGGRWGTADHEAKGRVAVGWQRASGVGVRAYAHRSYREAGDEPETSGVRNTIAAQEFGSDWTDPFDARGVGVQLDLGARLGARWRLDAAYETHDPLRVNATPATGTYEPTIPAWSVAARRVVLMAARATALAPLGLELGATLELRASALSSRDTVVGPRGPVLGRAALVAHAERPVGADRLVLHTTVAGVGGDTRVPPQEMVYLGGPVTGPGYDFHAFAARLGASQRVEWRRRVPFVAVPLGRFGRAPASATLAPYAHAIYVGRPSRSPDEGSGWYGAVGVGLITVFDLLRIDVARGVRGGRWTVGIDVARELWPIL
jgi:hypothetical protein